MGKMGSMMAQEVCGWYRRSGIELGMVGVQNYDLREICTRASEGMMMMGKRENGIRLDWEMRASGMRGLEEGRDILGAKMIAEKWRGVFWYWYFYT